MSNLSDELRPPFKKNFCIFAVVLVSDPIQSFSNLWYEGNCWQYKVHNVLEVEGKQLTKGWRCHMCEAKPNIVAHVRLPPWSVVIFENPYTSYCRRSPFTFSENFHCIVCLICRCVSLCVAGVCALLVVVICSNCCASAEWTFQKVDHVDA